MTQQRILVIRFSALGDVAMTLPVIYSVARLNPRTQFTVVTRPFFARLFLNCPPNVEAIGINPADYRGARGTLRLLQRLKELRPTAVADLHNVLRSWIIDWYFRLRGVRVAMADKKRSGRRRALRSGAQQQDFIDRYFDVFRRMDLKSENCFSSIFKNTQPEVPMAVGDRAIGIAPFARYFNKTYPPELMRRVVELLCADGAQVYLFGGRGEEAGILDQWADEIEGCQSVAGRFTIEQELALMGRMRVLCSMDSANQHLASLVGTPVVTLWGSTTPECGFMPFGQSADNSMVRGLECQPCTVAGSPECPHGHFKCMRELSPASVAKKLLELC